jgi:hypothetical protein
MPTQKIPRIFVVDDAKLFPCSPAADHTFREVARLVRGRWTGPPVHKRMVWSESDKASDSGVAMPDNAHPTASQNATHHSV